MSVDVEDWYDGMVVLGHDIQRPTSLQSGLSGLTKLLDAAEQRLSPKVTLFVVGNYVESVASELRILVSAGHEIASHGPDHGRVPAGGVALSEWLTRGREQLEQTLQVPVKGFRSPRFDLPGEATLQSYRESLAEAGFEYVSDTHLLGATSPVVELPILRVGRLPLGGGSYQRLLPSTGLLRFLGPRLAHSGETTVLYYHSYDFGATLPRAGHSVAVAKQVVGRGRIPAILARVLAQYGSRTCISAAVQALAGGTT